MIRAGHHSMMAVREHHYYVCPYHTFDGHSCVITDSVPDSTKKWRVVFNGTYVQGGEANVIGLYDNTTGTANRVYIGPYPNGACDRFELIASEYNISGASTNALCELICDIPNKLNTRIKNGQTTTKTIGNFGTFVTQKPVGLGARNNYNTSDTPRKFEMGFKGKIYSFEEWTSGTKTADWIPVVVGTEACYYDQITGKVYHADLTLGNPLTPGEWPVPQYTGVTLVGSVQNNNGILSGFTSSSYATMPFYMTSGATSLEAVIKIHHTGDSTAQGVWGCVGSKDSFTPFYQNGSGPFGSYISNNGTQWQATPHGDAGTKRVAWNNSSPFAAGDYILKEEWNGMNVTTHRWTNGAWTTETTNSFSSIYGEANLVPQLGTNRGQSNPFLGTIDLNYTYLMRDGQLLWEGVAGAYRNVATLVARGGGG